MSPHSPDVAAQAKSDITDALMSALSKNPKASARDAMMQATSQLMKNNPYNPPPEGRCPVNDLPPELLAYIFRVGKELQDKEREEGVSDDDDDEAEAEDFVDVLDQVVQSVVKGEDGKNFSAFKDLIKKVDEVHDDVPVDDGDEDWEDEEDEDEDGDDFEDESELPFQVLASHVCKHWREVALGVPALWTTITFLEAPPFEKSRAYIERAKGMPLEIYINATYPEGYDEDEEMALEHDETLHYDPIAQEVSSNRLKEPCTDPTHDHSREIKPLTEAELTQILDIITPIASQWRVFEFSASHYSFIHLLLTRLAAIPEAPLLQVFQLYHYEDCDDYDVFTPRELSTKFVPFHGNAPSLREVSLWGVHLDWEGSLPLLRGLHDLELAYHPNDVRPSWETFCAMIQNSPDLRTLSLSLSGPAGSPPEDWGTEPLEIPSLKDMVLCYHNPEYAVNLVQYLSVPNVHSLALDYDEEDYTMLAKQLATPIKGKSKSLLSQLHHLKIAGLPCSEKVVDEMYEQLAGLKSINLNCTGSSEEVFFDRLRGSTIISGSSAPPTPGGSNTPITKVFCPQLETITTAGIDGGRIQDFVEARISAGHPLKKVSMCEEDEIDSEDEKWITEHVDEFEFFEADSDDQFEDIDDDDDDMDVDIDD